jgi:hypothetical protein
LHLLLSRRHAHEGVQNEIQTQKQVQANQPTKKIHRITGEILPERKRILDRKILRIGQVLFDTGTIKVFIRKIIRIKIRASEIVFLIRKLFQQSARNRPEHFRRSTASTQLSSSACEIA